MGGGIGQYALYRAKDGSLCLFALVVPPVGVDSSPGERYRVCLAPSIRACRRHRPGVSIRIQQRAVSA
jgi:hypothetical protein